MVYVILQNSIPLMPCSNPIARLLLKQGRAKVKKLEPFTIKLTYETTSYTQDLTLGVDTGSGTIGTAVSKDDGDIVYMMMLNNFCMMQLRNMGMSLYRWKLTKTMYICCLNIAQRYLYQIS